MTRTTTTPYSKIAAVALLSACCAALVMSATPTVTKRAAVAEGGSSFSLLLVSIDGEDVLASAIRRSQHELRTGDTPRYALERLGWLFVERARTESDAGFYHLSLAAASALGEYDRDAGAATALLSRR